MGYKWQPGILANIKNLFQKFFTTKDLIKSLVTRTNLASLN